MSDRSGPLFSSASIASISPPALSPAEISTAAPNAKPFATRSESDQRLRARLIKLTVARLAAVSVLLAIALIAAGGAPSQALLGTVIVSYVLSIAYSAWLGVGRNLRALGATQIGLDLFVWIAVAVVTGGPTSPFGFFVAVPALIAALLLGSSAARVTAAASAVSFGLVTAAFTFRWPHFLLPLLPKIEMSRDEFAVHLIGHAVAIPLVAALGMALAERLQRAGGALAAIEAEHAELAVLYENVLRTVPVGLVSVDRNGMIEGANPMATQLLGRGPELLLGSSARAEMPWLRTDAFDSRSESSGENEVALPSNVSHVLWTVTPMRARSSGQGEGFLVVIEDRSQAEALRIEAEKESRLAVLGRLAAGLAHEIRNPLGAISGCVELVRENPAVMGEDRELLQTVLKETARLNRLVTDMLAFAKPPNASKIRLDLRIAVREFVALASNEYGDRLRLRTDVSAEASVPLWVDADAAQLQQVLWNLVRNAIQASPAREAVEVWAEADDTTATLCVADRGRGIGRESRERIFESFYSEVGTHGTGLGLAVVRQIVESHGGRIEPRERPGGGTMFVVHVGPVLQMQTSVS